jgi:hypothetical protein
MNTPKTMMNKVESMPDKFSIETVDQIIELWSKTYNSAGKPDWSHIIPYYSNDIEFRDAVQSLSGIVNFTAMTERLSARSNDLKMKVVKAVKEGLVIFVEWEMTIIFKNRPSSVIYGASRLILNEEGKIANQRDYYDLWGDIFDNIPRFNKMYRKFMHRKFG